MRIAWIWKVPDGFFLIDAVLTGPFASAASLYRNPIVPMRVQPVDGMVTHWSPPGSRRIRSFAPPTVGSPTTLLELGRSRAFQRTSLAVGPATGFFTRITFVGTCCAARD